MAVRLGKRRRHLGAFFWAVKYPNQDSNREYRLQCADKSFLHWTNQESVSRLSFRLSDHGRESPTRWILHDRGLLDFMIR
jgi:hypothetical protein